MTGKLSLTWLLAAAACLASCGGEGNSQAQVQPPGAPEGLDYPDPNLFTEGEPITPLVPRLSKGMSSNYWVEPELPAGLKLDGSTGIISGTPTEGRAEGTYNVSASNQLGRSQFGVRITVHGRFTLGGVVIGLTGDGLTLTTYGENLAVSANGRFAFAKTYATGSVFDIQVSAQPAGQTCTVTQGSGQVSNVDYGEAIVTCTGAAAVAAKGSAGLPYLTCFYLPAPGSTRGLAVNPATGFATPLGDLLLDPEPEHPQPPGCEFQKVTLDATHEWAYVRNVETQALRVYSIAKLRRMTVPLPGSLSTSSPAP